MPSKQSGQAQPPTNYRQTRRKQERNLLYLVLFVLVVVGTGLIGLIWGVNSAVLGGLCLVGGAVLIIGLWLLLSWIQTMIEE